MLGQIMTRHRAGDKPFCEPMISLIYWHSSLGFDELTLGVLNLFQEAQLYLHFSSFRNIAMAYVAEIIPGARQWHVYQGLSRLVIENVSAEGIRASVLMTPLYVWRNIPFQQEKGFNALI